jgi:hypothetical protein
LVLVHRLLVTFLGLLNIDLEFAMEFSELELLEKLVHIWNEQ